MFNFFQLLNNRENTSEAVYLVALILLVFVCFVIPWFVAFFFEFKVNNYIFTSCSKIFVCVKDEFFKWEKMGIDIYLFRS